MTETRSDRTNNKRVALVTGASGVIGAAIAHALGSAGLRVAVHYHHGKKSADEVVERIVAIGGEASAVEADLSRQESVAPMFERIEQQFGPVDYLVNNAGINRDVLLAFMSEEQWDEVIATNLRSTYLCSRSALPGMMRRGSGAICNIVSPAGIRGQPGQCNYSASKGGVASLTLPLSRDLARYGIRAVTIAPSLFESAMTARMGDKVRKSLERVMEFPVRAGKPEEFALLARQAVENGMLNGAVLRLDGAMRMPSKM